MEGPGVAPVRFKDIDRLADQFIEVRDEKAALATKLGGIEEKIAEKMVEHGIERYQFSDQEVILKKGKTHIKVKTVKADGVEVDPDDEP
jgi:hypothetical protein